LHYTLGHNKYQTSGENAVNRLSAIVLVAALAVSGCATAQSPSESASGVDKPQGVIAPSAPVGVEIRHILSADVSADRIEKDIRTLVGFGTRHTLSETESDTRGIGAARRWVEQELRKISAACGDCLEVITVSEVISGERRIPDPTEVLSVVAIQRGTLDPDRMVMMAGDIDSRVSDPLDGTSDSPGANDNASGLAGVIEAARVLSKYQFAGSIVYSALSGEEQGLFGGRIVAEHAIQVLIQF